MDMKSLPQQMTRSLKQVSRWWWGTSDDPYWKKVTRYLQRNRNVPAMAFNPSPLRPTAGGLLPKVCSLALDCDVGPVWVYPLLLNAEESIGQQTAAGTASSQTHRGRLEAEQVDSSTQEL
jgi:hypothetical protein